MILERFILKNDTFFLNSEGKRVLLLKGTDFGFDFDEEGNIFYVTENGDKFTSCDPDIPCRILNKFVVMKQTLFCELDPVSKVSVRNFLVIPENNIVFSKNNDGTYSSEDYKDKILKCFNQENLEQCFEYPSVKVKAEAETNSEEKVKQFELNPNAKYCGDDGIDAAILFLQTTDLSKHIVRDDNSHTLFVDLGPAEMWTDIDNSDWIMKLNARIPIASACSVCKRMVNGKPRLAVTLNSNFV
jgi:hypothetical protein